MKMKPSVKILLVTAILGAFVLSNPSPVRAQLNWQGRIMLKRGDIPQRDTLYIGCHSQGGPGWQPGLDVIDTSAVSSPLCIRSWDEGVQQQFNTPCPNLKRDIKDFKTRQVFHLLMASDTFPVFNNSVTFYWEKENFKFKQNNVELTDVLVSSNSVVLYGSPDTDSTWLYTNTSGSFNGDSCWFWIFSAETACKPFKAYIQLILYFDMQVGKQESTWAGSGLSFHPNPLTRGISLQQEAAPRHWQLRLWDLQGRCRQQSSINEASYYWNLQDLGPGIYILQATDEESAVTYYTKLIKR